MSERGVGKSGKVGRLGSVGIGGLWVEVVAWVVLVGGV